MFGLFGFNYTYTGVTFRSHHAEVFGPLSEHPIHGFDMVDMGTASIRWARPGSNEPEDTQRLDHVVTLLGTFTDTPVVVPQSVKSIGFDRRF